jgi:hypothetical protein
MKSPAGKKDSPAGFHTKYAFLNRLCLGHLPGDIYIERKGFQFLLSAHYKHYHFSAAVDSLLDIQKMNWNVVMTMINGFLVGHWVTLHSLIVMFGLAPRHTPFTYAVKRPFAEPAAVLAYASLLRRACTLPCGSSAVLHLGHIRIW